MQRWTALIAGATTAVIVGHFAASGFHWLVKRHIGLGTKPNPHIPRIPPKLTGIIERLIFFVILVAAPQDLATVAGLMIAWLGLKVAANWQRYDPKDVPAAGTHTLLALLTGVVSLAFAGLGAYVAICATGALGMPPMYR